MVADVLESTSLESPCRAANINQPSGRRKSKPMTPERRDPKNFWGADSGSAISGPATTPIWSSQPICRRVLNDYLDPK